MKVERFAEVKHALGSWPVDIVREMSETNEAAYLREFHSLNVGIQMVDTSWRTAGLAVGYLKRVAKNTPDKGSTFVLVPWDGKYTIYFR